MQNVIIIGGGLTGLTIAYHFTKKNIPFLILEAQNKAGGRIETIKGELDTPMDMGATWFSNVHTNLLALLKDLQIEYFPSIQKERLFFKLTLLNLPRFFMYPKLNNLPTE